MDLLKVRTEDEVLTLLLETVRQRVKNIKNKERDNALWTANGCLFTWLFKRGKAEKLDNFPVLAVPNSDRTQKILRLSSTCSAADRPLAPVSVWPEVARPYAELFPEAIIMDQHYATTCDDAAAWHMLSDSGFIHLAPLYEVESVVEEFLPDEPLPDDEQMARPRSDKAVPRTELSWLTKPERSVIDRVRGSQTRAVKMLRFCIDYVLPADLQAFEVETIQCDNGVEHRYFRAHWLGPLRTRRWVPLERGKSVTPSAESLAKLLVEEPDLLKRLGEDRISRFLEILGVSSADLALRSVGRDDRERMSLIQSLAAITAAAGNDPARVQALAGAIQKDPQVLKIVEDRNARMERVARNQELGDLVERLFKETLSSSDLAVHRTGVGSDFRVEAPPGEEEDAAHLEIAGDTKSVLVEVKATTGNTVRMSVRQVEQAVLNKHRYFLCVVTASDGTMDAETFKSQVKFVVDIGDRLKNIWKKYCSMQSVLGEFEIHETDLTVEMTKQDARFCISQAVWSDKANFVTAIKLLQKRVLRK